MADYRAVVVGCGRAGSLYDCGRPEGEIRTHAGAYASNSQVALAAGVDPLAERRGQFTRKWNAPAFSNTDALAKQLPLQLWSVCTPPEAHLEAGLAAIRGGARAIWCEKPMAASLEQAVKLAAACEAAGVALSINHSRRFDALHQDIARRLQAMEWGRVQRVLIHYVRGIANYGSHAFDLLRFLLGGEIKWVAATDSLKESQPDPSLTVYGEMQEGASFALLPLDRRGYDCFEADVWCSLGRITITHLGRSVREYRVGRSPHWDEPAVLLETDKTFPAGMGATAPAALANLIDHLDRGAALLSSGSDGLAALAAVAASQYSAQQSGSRVDVPTLLAQAKANSIQEASYG